MEGVDDGLEREGGNAVADDQPNAGGEEEERADDAAYGWCQLKLLGISKALSLKSSSLFRSFPTNERWWPHCGHEPKRAVEKCVREEGSGRTDRATSRVPERDPDEPIAQPPGTDCVRARSGRTDLATPVLSKGPDPDEPISKPKPQTESREDPDEPIASQTK